MLHHFAETVDLEQQITSLGMKTVMIAGLVLLGCTIIAALLKNHYAKLKLPLFIMMAGTLIISTVILFGSTIYLNTKAESGGPVHWHSEIEFWACGTELELRDPTGTLSNKIGTATYHEHNDKHIHLEGVVVKRSHDASLGKFMDVVGGSISDQSVSIPLNADPSTWFANEASDTLDGDKQGRTDPGSFSDYVKSDGKGTVLQLINGRQCNDRPAELQVFAYKFDKESKTYTQTKVNNPADYVIRDESSLGPPSDCVIVEFDVRKAATDKLCRQYGIRDERRCTEFGVEKFTPELCNIRQDLVPVELEEDNSSSTINEFNKACQEYIINIGNPRHSTSLSSAEIKSCFSQYETGEGSE